MVVWLWLHVSSTAFAFPSGLSSVLDILDVTTTESTTAETLTNHDGDEVWFTRPGRVTTSTTTEPARIPKSETLQAVEFLNTIGATKFKTEEAFLGDNFVTREQAAQLAFKRLSAMPSLIKESDNDCEFSDIDDTDSTLTESVRNACKYWLFAWYEWLFSPKDTILRWHFFMVVLRAVWADVPEAMVYDEVKKRWYTTTIASTFWFNDTITRRDASLILYRVYMESKEGAADLTDLLWDLFGDDDADSSDESMDSMAEWSSSQPQPTNTTPLQGWQVDDNILFDDFLAYYEEAQPKFWKEYTAINIAKRYSITVKNSEWTIWWLSVTIEDNLGTIYEVSVDNQWAFMFYPSAYYNDESILDEITEYTLTATYGWEKKSIIMNATDTKATLTFDFTINYIVAPTTTLQLAFVIDTTWSMGDQIARIKETIKSVSLRVKDENPDLVIEYGLVAYKDKRDQYLTSTYQFTTDLEEYQTRLNALSAWGWWDYPEDINSWLEDAMEYLSWSDAPDTYGIIFLVADAPPHMDYDQQYDYRVALLRAVEQWVKIFPLASSGLDNTVWELIFRQIALITNASYIFITKWSTWETDFNVDEQSYSVADLDDLIVDIIINEL